MIDADSPGPRSRDHWQQEQVTMGPGLQAVVQWSQLCIVEGRGALLTDADHKTYIDLMGGAGVNSIGHSHPKFVDALSDQLRRWSIGSFASEARLRMLRTLKRVLPAGLERVQLYSSGAEAVEAALRLAKSYTQKFEFLSFWNGFHGKTLGSLALTDGARMGLGPIAPGFYSAPYAYCYRCPFKLRFPECGFACVEHARAVIRHQTSGALAGIVVEPIQGRAGNLPPPPGYLRALESVAREFDALLIADETLTGFGRSGTMFACECDEVVPDIMIVGKGMGGGYPVTGVISTTAIMSASPYADPSASSSSYGGFPLACQAVDATLNVLIDENLVEHSAALGASLLQQLEAARCTASIVGDVRGRGLMIGIELIEDAESRQPASMATVRQVYRELLRAGVIVMTGGNSLRLYPPLSIEDDLAHRATSIIIDVLRDHSTVRASS